MAKRTPGSLLKECVSHLDGATQLTERASVWRTHLAHFNGARFKMEHYIQIVELSFMRLFLTWEGFIEEAFILYLLGKESPNGYKPSRHALPTSRQHAIDLLASDARHTDWTAAARIVSRADRFFVNGGPFVAVIRPQSNLLDNMKTIRNALSHDSEEAFGKFQTLVRNELSFFPKGMVPGTFLATTKPHVSPPVTFLQFYADAFRSMAESIVP